MIARSSVSLCEWSSVRVTCLGKIDSQNTIFLTLCTPRSIPSNIYNPAPRSYSKSVYLHHCSRTPRPITNTFLNGLKKVNTLINTGLVIQEGCL